MICVAKEYLYTVYLFQIIEALHFLHYTTRQMHRNVCPQVIIVTKRGTWKLFGLEFIGKYIIQNCIYKSCIVGSYRMYIYINIWTTLSNTKIQSTHLINRHTDVTLFHSRIQLLFVKSHTILIHIKTAFNFNKSS